MNWGLFGVISFIKGKDLSCPVRLLYGRGKTWPYLAFLPLVPPRTILSPSPPMTTMRAPGMSPVSLSPSEEEIIALVREWMGHHLFHLLHLTLNLYPPTCCLDSLPLTLSLLSSQTRTLTSQIPSLMMRRRRVLSYLTLLMLQTSPSLAHNPS